MRGSRRSGRRGGQARVLIKIFSVSILVEQKCIKYNLSSGINHEYLTKINGGNKVSPKIKESLEIRPGRESRVRNVPE